MNMSTWAVVALATFSLGQSRENIKQDEIDYQNESFQSWWETPLVWQFDQLPAKGQVPDFRVPYSGHDYPDRAGGTVNVMRKYDRAFHRGRALATAYEEHDTTAFQEMTVERRGLFGLRRVQVSRTPGWHGHCNGWTAAAIRHAEPQQSVIRNGVKFSPADIKGLLAEIYMYRDVEYLGGDDDAINPGLLHVSMSNWLGRGSLPVAMDKTLGEEVWNYPLYAYATTARKLSDKEVEVKMNAYYSQSTRREFDHAQHLRQTIYFHYALKLNDEGAIIGGRYYNDSNRIDFLWEPLKPVQGGTEGNKRGNPHLDVKEVLAIWRESVPASLREQWLNIDPTEEDRLIPQSPASESAIEPAMPEPANITPATGEASATAESTPTTAPPVETATAEPVTVDTN